MSNQLSVRKRVNESMAKGLGRVYISSDRIPTKFLQIEGSVVLPKWWTLITSNKSVVEFIPAVIPCHHRARFIHIYGFSLSQCVIWCMNLQDVHRHFAMLLLNPAVSCHSPEIKEWSGEEREGEMERERGRESSFVIGSLCQL